MRVKKTPQIILAERLLQGLRDMKSSLSATYPPSVSELAAFLDPEAAPILIAKSVAGKKPFGENAVVLQQKNPDSPVALKGDEAALLNHPRTFVFLLELACSPSKPTVEAGKLRSKVPASLRTNWDAALTGHLERLPEGVAALQVGRKRLLHLTRHPLPQPAEELLAGRMMAHLRSRRGESNYPMTLASLQRESAPDANGALLKKALASLAFQQATIFGMKVQPHSPVALAQDRETLASSDVLLTEALRGARSGLHQAVSAADLKKKVTRDLQSAFATSLMLRREDGRMPSGIGCVLQKKAPVFFFLNDLIRGSKLNELNGGSPERITRQGATFENDFDAAFTLLDQAKGSHNFVSLLDLRPRLGLAREVFDEGLRSLRREGKYTLSASEGRHGLTQEELGAGVREDGAHLLYVSRKK